MIALSARGMSRTTTFLLMGLALLLHKGAGMTAAAAAAALTAREYIGWQSRFGVAVLIDGNYR
jgi:hypothetical protein